MTRQTFFRWCVALALAYGFLRWLLAPLLPFLIALTVAVIIEPWVLFCLRRLRFKRKFSAVVFSTVLVGGILGVTCALALRLLTEAALWLEQLPAADDPETLFAELADEYSEDPSRAEHPTGYIYTANTMLPEFESAAAQLEPGEISDIVQSDYGFHIILRRDLVAALREDESQKVDIARAYLDQLLSKQNSSATVTYDECLEDIDWTVFYADYIAAVDQLAAGTASD